MGPGARSTLRRADKSTARVVLKKRARAQKQYSGPDVVRCIDHALSLSLGAGLERFRPQARLTVADVRAVLDGAGPGVRGGREGREGRAGLDLASFFGPLVVFRSDEEGKQARAMHCLVQHCGLRAAFFRDPCHRDWNDAQAAVKRAGLWGARGPFFR